MAGILRPRRGAKSLATSQNIVLARGEIFFECPESGVGTGLGRLKIGDGSTNYTNLPYFMDIENTPINFIENTSTSNDDLLKSIKPGEKIINITAAMKRLLDNLNSSLNNLSSSYSANSANKLNTDAGAVNIPVYFKNGIPVVCTSVNLNAASATKLETTRTFSINGDASASGTFNGTDNLTLALTLANTDVKAGSYGPAENASPAHSASFSVPYVTVDSKGRVTAISTKTITLPSYSAGTGMVLSGTVFSLGESGVTAGSYGLSADASPSHSGTFSVPYITVDKYGRVTSASTKAITLPSYGAATTGALGLVKIGSNISVSSGTISLSKANIVAALGYTPPTQDTTYSAGTGLSLSSNAFSLSTSGATAGSYGPSANASPAHGETFSVPYVTVDKYGRVTGISNKTITLPAQGATSDVNVTQTNTSTSANYRLLFSANANDTTETSTARKSSKFTVNPSTGDFSASGTITGSKVYNAVWNDYAEYYEKGEETEVGDIIALDINSDREQYDKAVFGDLVCGVHSNTYGHIVGGKNVPEDYEGTFEDYNEEFFIPVGMTGRVMCKVIGEIKKLDKIYASQIPGVGTSFKYNNYEYFDSFVGYALEDYNSDEVGLIKIKLK